MRYLMTISYDGSKYYGFQKLNDKKSIQGELERVLSKINKREVFVKGAGRTDRGVHAYGQCVHFDLDINISVDGLIKAVNSMIDKYIHVLDCKIVSSDFHARFLVKEKKYKYIINTGKFNPILEDYVYNYNNELNITNMKRASKYLIGKHSFKVFVSGDRDNYNSEIFKVIFNKDKDFLSITFVGKSFYRYMVRNMVGALILVGKNKISVDEFKNMLDSDDSKYTYMTVPANGLYLESVRY
ncbi:MAG: tRNA pseudouridine(38-40) synthase TruA [Bacilli bacterium]|nr:tRNA pseudouridine(38-40) synthase TruA [Bacilli bacterium]